MSTDRTREKLLADTDKWLADWEFQEHRGSYMLIEAMRNYILKAESRPGVAVAPPSYRMPPCATCGHPWAVHVIPGGVENIDVYPHERHCADCGCRSYVEPALRAVAPPLAPFLFHRESCAAWPDHGEWRDADAVLCTCGLATAVRAVAPPPRKGCINCGEADDGGYETVEGNVSWFCSQCWEYLREEFQEVWARHGEDCPARTGGACDCGLPKRLEQLRAVAPPPPELDQIRAACIAAGWEDEGSTLGLVTGVIEAWQSERKAAVRAVAPPLDPRVEMSASVEAIAAIIEPWRDGKVLRQRIHAELTRLVESTERVRAVAKFTPP